MAINNPLLLARETYYLVVLAKDDVSGVGWEQSAASVTGDVPRSFYYSQDGGQTWTMAPLENGYDAPQFEVMGTHIGKGQILAFMTYYYYCGPKCKECGNRIPCAEIKFDADALSPTQVWGSEPFVTRCRQCGRAFEYDKSDPDNTATFAMAEPIKDFHTHPSFVSIRARA
jgi:hypothetical protein